MKCHADVRDLHVRDHYYASPAYYKREHGDDLWTAFLDNARSFYDKPLSDKTLALFEGLARYFASTTAFEDYGGGFVCEELWYGRPIEIPDTMHVKEITDGLDSLT